MPNAKHEKNIHRFGGVAIRDLVPGDLFCLPWDPFLYGPLGRVLGYQWSRNVIITNLGTFGPKFRVIRVEKST